MPIQVQTLYQGKRQFIHHKERKIQCFWDTGLMMEEEDMEKMKMTEPGKT